MQSFAQIICENRHSEMGVDFTPSQCILTIKLLLVRCQGPEKAGGNGNPAKSSPEWTDKK